MLPSPTLPATWRGLLEMFRPAFRRSRTFGLFVLLATGLVAQAARRTVVGMLVGAGVAASPPAISIPSWPTRAWTPPAAAPSGNTSLAQGTIGWNLFGLNIIGTEEGVSHDHHDYRRGAARRPRSTASQLRLPHARAIAADVLATARAQRWDPTEVVKALLTEETAGRGRSMLASRRKAAGFPTGKTFRCGTQAPRGSRRPPGRRCKPWNGSSVARTSWSAGPPAPERRSSSKRSGRRSSKPACRWPGSPSSRSGCSPRAPRDDSLGKAIAEIVRAELVVVDDVECFSSALTPPKRSTASSKRAMNANPWRSPNLHPSGFDELMPKTLATAAVDRLLHHAHLCQTSGDSVRLAQALHGKGVKPLT